MTPTTPTRRRTTRGTMSLRTATLLIVMIVATFAHVAVAFDFFNLFNQGGNQEQQQDKRQESSGSAADGCLDYKCSVGDLCVASPSECPCPVGKTKCPIGDWYTCVAPGTACTAYLRAINPQFSDAAGAAVAGGKDEL
ncbi:hypothetical protein AMAG_19236 [Allomyces macrogynus ATCC 38327]|uniref:Long chronological lifespan protein 2 n=1 Tax=Allomyces macrogynus (strain ATCC 38327) TaxID=578462 RepID=A0A0L0STP7_ALLM3|nr:hypothetical protein AMAG_19236 [Allomyces macrogynus ATCC 38327]|eukprot:KNE65902.1 hypothetical protein AMAG_19236 [Allomyces macrogynus ATCC 38327]